MYCGKINRAVCAKGTAGAGEGGSPLLPPSRSYCNLALENTIVGTSPRAGASPFRPTLFLQLFYFSLTGFFAPLKTTAGCYDEKRATTE